MSEMQRRVAKAIEDAVVGSHIELVALIDGASTYSLTYDDGGDEVLTFTSYADAAGHVDNRLHRDRARAAIAAMLSPTSKMINEGGAQVYLAGEDAKPSEIAVGVWRDMIAEALREDPA